MEPDRVVVVDKEMPMDVVMERWVRFVAAAAAMWAEVAWWVVVVVWREHMVRENA